MKINLKSGNIVLELRRNGWSGITNALFLFIFFCFSARAQGTIEDYRRSEVMKRNMESKIFYAPKEFHWLKTGHKFWYLNSTPHGREFVLVNADLSTRKPAFDQADLAIKLSIKNGIEIKPYDLPFNHISFIESDKEIEFVIEGILWRYNILSKECRKTSDSLLDSELLAQGEIVNHNRQVESPDGEWIAFIKNYNVYVRSFLTKSEEYQFSFDGSKGEFYDISSIVWAPDSERLAVNRVRSTKPRMVHLIESSPVDQLQPKLHSRIYLKPGDALPQKRPTMFIIEGRKQFNVDPFLISNQRNISDLVWRKDSRAFTFEYNQRGHQLYKVYEMDGESGTVRTLINEETATFINNRKKYRYDAGDGSEIIWASERDGWNHLYLYNGGTGEVKNQITKGNWVVRNVINVDEATRTILFEGSGRETGQDPYLIQLYEVQFDGTGIRALTNENANHLTFFSPDYSFFVDSFSRIDLPPMAVLRAADGKILMELEKADIKNLIDEGWKIPEVFNAKGRDGKTDIWGIIVRPSNFQPNRKYPIIEYIYAGPHDSFVPKSFISEPRGGDYRKWTTLHEVAELGFIVVQIDGMGTSNRSKVFHDVAWMNLKDAGFPDRIRWITAASQKYPYMDVDNVGIFGNSSGGQSSVGALLFHHEFYKVAVSSSGCHDNRIDKLGWNEQWMGYPVGSQYAESSNVENAYKLKGDLLLILGEMDMNVPPESTLQLVNALIKANKDFDFLLIPGMGHSMGGDYGERKRRDFFVEHLLEIAPPEWEGEGIKYK